MTSPYALMLEERAERHRHQHGPIALAVCTCGASWTVSSSGRPLSWLGEWAAERHTDHHVEVRRM